MMNIFSKLKNKLVQTKDSFIKSLDRVIFSRQKVDLEILDDLEEVLISADLGIHTTTSLLEALKAEIKAKKFDSAEEVKESLKAKIMAIMDKGERSKVFTESKPALILIVGVNGSGKTTSIGKLAAMFSREGKKVMLAAGDTFRAAAIEQLEIWAQRSKVEIIKHQAGADPSAVVFDGIRAAKGRGYDVVIADTAGRLQTKVNLMEELKKIKRVAEKELSISPEAINPYEVLLVLDSTTGQNAIQQATIFKEAVGVTGIILTKLDSAAKAGVVINIVDSLDIPIKYISFGEGIEDIDLFDPKKFVSALFEEQGNDVVV